MKNFICFLFLIMCLQISASAQFNHGSEQAESINIKYITKDETLKLATNIGNLTVKQTEDIYITNLQINRRVFREKGNKTIKDKNDKIFLRYAKEKESAYKKILTPEQFEKYLQKVKKSDSKIVNTNVKISNSTESLSGNIFPSSK